MSDATIAAVPPRKPRLLWANAYCLLDTSSGANMAVAVRQTAPGAAAPLAARPRTHSARPKISVIFPVYNRAAFLREALESVLAQSFGDFEFLIIHDGVCEPVRALIES